METPRFKIVKNFGGIRFIKDTKDNTIVAMLYGASKPAEQVAAMQKVILDALNRAGSPQLRNNLPTGPEAA